jgi:hypothetical protein
MKSTLREQGDHQGRPWWSAYNEVVDTTKEYDILQQLI